MWVENAGMFPFKAIADDASAQAIEHIIFAGAKDLLKKYACTFGSVGSLKNLKPDDDMRRLTPPNQASALHA